ncbi:Protein of unknown function DUF1262 [Macleaya cordata]|uniref:Uncharacterized protein n=1 Tax=Macleaya cordata TaxID=56857 RepID=A0A200R8D0_MACCD|nr:Protein of unknown function DUF1262 [Macleaya cordata]
MKKQKQRIHVVGIVDIVYTVYLGDRRQTKSKTVWFIPVIGYPLSSNRYYVVRATGRHKGQACTCSREEDMSTCCFRNIVNDVTPRALDHKDIYQQVEIFKSRRGFAAKSVAPDGLPPHFLRRKGWRVNTLSSYHRQLGEALGLNVSLCMRLLPEFINFPMSSKFSKAEVVGRWYCPFVFIMERRLGDQMTNSLFYEMTLEQTWEEIYTCENDKTLGNIVAVNVTVPKDEIKLFRKEAMKDDKRGADGYLWFRHVKDNEDGSNLGLSLAIVEKMRWIQENEGCVGGGERYMKVEKEFKGEWMSLKIYEGGGVLRWRWVEEVWLLCVGGEVCFKENGWNLVTNL